MVTTLLRLAWGLTLLVGLALTDTARAQPCASDVQCQLPGVSNAMCIGDTLVTRRSICVGGQCQTQEMRQNCSAGGPIGGTCQGNVFIRSGGGCDGLSGRCGSGIATREVCQENCSCRGNRLVVSTGQCSPGLGCGRAVVQCKSGCTCSPEPRCLEDPEPKARPKAKTTGDR